MAGAGVLGVFGVLGERTGNVMIREPSEVTQRLFALAPHVRLVGQKRLSNYRLEIGGKGGAQRPATGD